MSRDVNMFIRPELLETLQSRALDELGLTVRFSCIDRTYKEQAAYFAQGRESLSVVNRLRQIAGLPGICEKENQRCVTWTMNSKHIVNLEDERLDNDKSYAADFFLLDHHGVAVWEIKADINEDEKPDYLEVAELAEDMGFVSGFRFKNQDPPHLEWPREGATS